MTNQQKIEVIDYLISYIEQRCYHSNPIYSRKNIDYLNELKGFIDFTNKYGESKLDVMNIANLCLSKINMPKDINKFSQSVWFAFRAGMKYQKEKGDENVESGKD